MDQRQHLRQEIDRAASNMVTKVNELEQRAVEIKENLQSTLTLEGQAERPWRLLGAALGLGALAGLLLR